MIESKIDGTKVKNLLGLSIHLKKHGLTVLEYYQKYEGFEIPKCVVCGEDAKLHQGLTFRDTCGSNECFSQICKRPHSLKTREKMRKSRNKYLSKKANRKGTAWSKRWNGEMTYGEKRVHELFSEAGIYTQYDVVNEYSEYPYFIDFAFVNEKVAVEFDGKCHFSNGNKRVEHDLKRDKYLEEKGWRMYRIPYFELDDFQVSDLVDFIGTPSRTKRCSDNLIKYRSYIGKYPQKKKSKHKKDKKMKTQKQAQKLIIKGINEFQKYLKKDEMKEKVLNSNIDFSKFGWVTELAPILGMTAQATGRWVRKNMPDFYEEHCFRRK